MATVSWNYNIPISSQEQLKDYMLLVYSDIQIENARMDMIAAKDQDSKFYTVFENYNNEKSAENHGFIASACDGIKDGLNTVTDATVGFVKDGYNAVADATAGFMKGAASCTKDVVGSVINTIF